MTEPTNEELIDAIGRVNVSKPAPTVDPDAALGRGRRSLRRRRIAAVSGVAGLVAAVAVTVTVVANSVTPARPPVANTPTPLVSTSTISTPAAAVDYLDPMPGTGRGDAALGPISRPEAQRRCGIRNPGNWTLSNGAFYTGGGSTNYGGGQYGWPEENGPRTCVVPGDSRPTAAGQAVLTSDPLPKDTAGRVRNCSVLFWHDVRSWRVLVTDEAPGVEIRLRLISPSRRYEANCILNRPTGVLGQDYHVRLSRVHDDNPRPALADLINAGSACKDRPNLACTGWLRSETGRIRGDVVRIVLTSTTGATHQIRVVDGFYALAWVDPSGSSSLGAVKAYDADGKVVYQR